MIANHIDTAPLRHLGVFLVSLLLVWAGPLEAGAQQADDRVHGHVEGTVTVSPEVDDSGDYSGFDVLVAQQTPEGVDTLGHATTDVDGRFAMEVVAPQRDLYSLVIQRRNETVASTSLVVADGDSASFEVDLPMERPIRVSSFENSAWMAYENTMGVHRQRLIDQLQAEDEDLEAFQTDQMEGQVRQTADILWNLQDSYESSLGAQYAMAESATMLVGWDEALALDRAERIEPTNPRFAEVGQSVRPAVQQMEGRDAAVAFLQDFHDRATTTDQRAALRTEMARLYIEEGEQDEALAIAEELREEYPDTPWAEWAERAEYEVRNLMPGMAAPTFTAETVEEQSIDLDALQGQPVLLEFYVPSNDLFQRQLPERNALHEGASESDLAYLSISLQPDTLQNEAFFDGREVPGTHVFATEELAESLIETYNIGALPTRVLIDAEGNIVNKYEGGALGALQDELTTLIGEGEDGGIPIEEGTDP